MKSYTGTWRLIRLALRRDRITLPINIVLVALMAGASAPALVTTYGDVETQTAYVLSSAPSIVGRLFQGTVQGVNLGSIVMAEVYLFTAVLMAIMSIFIITRHTRHNEETGSGEMIAAGIVGRKAMLTAALVVAVGANILTGLLIFAMYAPITELDATGSAFMSLSLTMVGIFFAGVASITAQLSGFRRGANGMAIGILIAFFLIRGAGDALGDISTDGLSVTPSWLTWLSPFGWGYQVLPYNGDKIFPLILLATAIAVTFVVGFYLLRKRDVGSGLFPARAGSARAKKSLLGASRLARRLQRGGLIGWSFGFAISGLLMGVLTNDFRATFEEAEAFQNLLEQAGGGGNFAQSVFAAMFPLMAAMLAGYVVSALLKMYDEEASGRVEYLFGTALGRARWAMSHIGNTLFGIVFNLFIMGAIGGGAYAYLSEAGDATFLEILGASLANIPAMALFMAIIVFVYSIFGRFVRSFAWSFYAYVALISSIASIFTWPQWVLNISPFSHTPPVPSDDVDIFPLYVMSAAATFLIAASLVALRRRDVNLK